MELLLAYRRIGMSLLSTLSRSESPSLLFVMKAILTLGVRECHTWMYSVFCIIGALAVCEGGTSCDRRVSHTRESMAHPAT